MDEKEIVELYNEGYSPYQIAEKFSTYTQKIRRMLKKSGVQLRNKSEAQKLALENGRSAHPTKGRQRTEEEKLSISKGLVDTWASITDEERERRREQSQEIWNSMTEEQQEDMRKKAAAQIRIAAKEGSKLELEVQKMLSRHKYRYEAHKKDLIPTKKLEIDIFVPSLRTIIEVDGLSHFEPIWGEEHLIKQMKFDAEKDGTILSRKFNIIRVENTSTGSLALAKIKELETKLIKALSKIKETNATSTLQVIKYE